MSILEFETQEHITPQEFVESCTDNEIEELKAILRVPYKGLTNKQPSSVLHEEFLESLHMLQNSYFSLPMDIVNLIIEIRK